MSASPKETMAGLLLVWANLPEEAMEWYEEVYIPDMTELHSTHTLHCQLGETGLEADSLGTLDAPWDLMAVYEVKDVGKMHRDTYDKRNHPPEEMTEILKDARFDVRTYREIRRWGDEDWDGDYTQIVSVAAMEWRVSADDHDEVLKFYTENVAPMIASSPDVLRFRLLQVFSANVLQGESYVSKEKDGLHTYLTVVEFQTEDWPWDKVIELAEIEKWRTYFETQEVVKWQTSHYFVQRTYPEADKAGALEDDGKRSKAES